ncbi:CAP-Gly domain-containing linker protein 1-like isoform X2 [Mytilus edulis]|uniref:CAP-Gly domain-containing linker protein 1-like isoform X2 n=1 Tax=Mytilus edulis TaxID=6550 RepID=UPI0039EF9782
MAVSYLDIFYKYCVVKKGQKSKQQYAEMANYKSKVQQLQLNVAQLLSKKKSLNSKVVSQEFEAFQEAVDKIQNDEGSALEVKQTLVGLEKALKKEGLFKNVKGLFVGMKKEFLSSPSAKPQPLLDLDALDDDEKKENRSRAPTAVTHRSETKPPARYAATVHIEDVKSVNRAVGKLFVHLKPQKGSESKDVTMLSIQGRSSTVVKMKDFDDSNFSDVIKRLKQFEKELNRQRAAQHTEIMRLSDENQLLRKHMTDLRKDHDRIKGTQPISSRAKGKQVEIMEKKFRSQKKGMEGKISEIESELQVSLEKTLKEKDVLEQMIMDGVTRLKTAIISLHKKLCGGEGDDREMTTITEKDEDSGDESSGSPGAMSVDELMKNISSIEDEAQTLQDRNDRLQLIIKEKESEIHQLRTAVTDISNEIGKMHGTVTQLDGSAHIKHGRGSIGSISVSGLDTKEKELAIAKLQQVNASIQQYKRLLLEGSKPNLKQKDEMQPLTLQINKMYNEFKKDVEGLDSEKSGLSMDTLLDEPTQRDEVNVMVKKLTKIQKAYKILKEKESEK